MTDKKLTIRDVARHAGVSVGTASRAMNAAPGVTDSTRDRVRQAAHELGYQPNAAARALRSRSSRLIGCLFSDLENPLYMKLYNALQDRWAQKGFVTLMTSSSGLIERERRAVATFAERGLDAIVVAPGHQDDPELVRLLNSFSGPIFVVDRDTPIAADRLLFDHEGAMRLVVDYLAGLGHQRIMPVISRQATRPGLMRRTGFDMAMRSAGLSPGPVIEPETPNTQVFAEVTRVLTTPDRPTAMVVQGTQILSSTLNALARLGLRVPSDMSLVAIGDSTLTQDHVPPITTIRIDRDTMIDTIATRVLDRIKGDRSAPTDRVLQYELIERASCAGPGGSD